MAAGRSSLLLILGVAVIDLIPFGLIIPLQGEYARRFGISNFAFGCLLACYALSQFVCSPVLGRLSDRVGRRPVLIACMVGSSASHVLLGLADIQRVWWWLFVARIVDGITGGNIATVQAYIADITSPADRARGMGLFGAAFGLGFVLGPAVGAGLYYAGSMVSSVGTAWPAFGAAALSATAAVLVWAVLPEPPVVRRREPAGEGWFVVSRLVRGRVAWRGEVGVLVVLFFVITFAFVQLEATFVYLCKDRFGWKPGGIGLVFAYLGVLMMVVQGGLVGPMVRRFGEAGLVSVGPFLVAGGFVAVSLLPSVRDDAVALGLLLSSSVVFSVGWGLCMPSLSGLISRCASAEAQGGTLGVNQGLASLARTVAPPIAGLLYDVRPEWPYWFAAVILAVAGGVWVVQARQRVARAAVGERRGG